MGMADHNATHKVVVIGGGYAGTTAANHLRKRGDVDITLVNPRPTVEYGTLLGDGIRLVVDDAVRIDTAARKVELASGTALDYDYVIYAVGSTTAASSVPGVSEFAYPIADLEHAHRLREAIAELHPDAPVTVVGAGLTGTETASELAEQGRKVTLVCGGRLAPSLGAPGRRSTAKWFAKHGVAVLENEVVTEVRRGAVVFADGAVRPSALTIWTAGFGVPDLAAASGLRTDGLGRLLTDETLTSVDDVRIVAAGDAAAPSGQPLRMSCQAAGPLGAQAANTVLSRIAGSEPAPLDQAFVAQCVSLGRHAATFQLTRKDDTPVNFFIGGRLGAAIKEFICKGTVWGLRREARKPGSTVYLKGGTRPEQRAHEVTPR
jgi:NADH dehydrogenase